MPGTRPAARSIAMTGAYALVGWGLCGATMFAAMALTTLAQALAVHALAAPLIFAAISFVYFRRPGSWSPLGAAAAFLGIVVAMDAFVVALIIQKSFEMFESVRGSWLPFTLIFAATWWTGRAVRRVVHRAAQ